MTALVMACCARCRAYSPEAEMETVIRRDQRVKVHPDCGAVWRRLGLAK